MKPINTSIFDFPELITGGGCGAGDKRGEIAVKREKMQEGRRFRRIVKNLLENKKRVRKKGKSPVIVYEGFTK